MDVAPSLSPPPPPPPAAAPTPTPTSLAATQATSHDSLSRAPTLTNTMGVPPSQSGGPETARELKLDEKAGEPIVISFETPGLERLNPRSWSHTRRAFIATQGALSMLAVTFGTSAYTGGIPGLEAKFGVGSEVATLGLSTFTLALALGSLFWAPLSEVIGRRLVLLSSLSIYVLFGLGPVLAQNIETILITRFLMSLGGSSIMSNAPGMLSDLYGPKEIGLAMTINSVAPFLGPVLGPLIGGYISMYAGINAWRWINGVICMFGVAIVLSAVVFVPETYPSVLLRKQARRLEKETGRPHVSVFDVGQPKTTIGQKLSVGLRRPFVFLFCEPIVLLLSLYTAVIFGILYIFFAGFPVIFQSERGWSQGVGALPFVAMAIGLLLGVPISIYCLGLYRKAMERSPTGRAEPEERLYFAMLAAVLLVVSLLWFAFTAPASVPWPASVVSIVFFGIGMIGMMSSIMSYLSDTYTIYAASVFAGNSLLRYILGAAFPLYARVMFVGMTPRWALFLLAMVALVMAPMPFLFFRYGKRIRAYSKHVPQTVVPLPPASPDACRPDDLERQLSPPPAVFLAAQGVDAVRVQELQDGIVPPPGQAADFARLDSRRSAA